MIRFALNHMLRPLARFATFAQCARAVSIADVEIRNDLPGVEIADGTPATALRAQADDLGVRVIALNALQRFDNWTDARAAEAEHLAAYAGACNADLVLCPVNDRADDRGAARRADDLRRALRHLVPILERHHVRGLIEPLGFPECALRTKAEALAAIDQIGTGHVFTLLHDTFHHALSGEREMFPSRTGLVHVSGVTDAALPIEAIRDEHRELVTERDRLGTLAQIRQLHEGGYSGLVSLEPFTSSVHTAPDADQALAGCIGLLRSIQ